MRKKDVVAGKTYSNGHPEGSQYRTVRKVLEIYTGHYVYTGREEQLVRYQCTEGNRDAKDRENEITLQAFAIWAKAVV